MMSAQEMLDEMKMLADDFMILATELSGAPSGIAAEYSQKLQDMHEEATQRFSNAGSL
jgi:hypothetical protein